MFCYACILFVFFFFSSFDILSTVTDVLLLWAASLIGLIVSLAACHCVIVIVLCYLKLVWQINSLSHSWYQFVICGVTASPEVNRL